MAASDVTPLKVRESVSTESPFERKARDTGQMTTLDFVFDARNAEKCMGTRRIGSDQAYEEFAQVLAGGGVREALAYIVQLTNFRFIGLWRLQDGMATAVVHFDRENPDQMHPDEVRATDTYCCIVRDRRGEFMTANAMLDPVIGQHPAQESVPAYFGVPLIDSAGALLGTLCLYDVVPRNTEQVDISLMLGVASMLANGGFVPPYPQFLPANRTYRCGLLEIEVSARQSAPGVFNGRVHGVDIRLNGVDGFVHECSSPDVSYKLAEQRAAGWALANYPPTGLG